MPISHLFFNLQHSYKHKVSDLHAARLCCEIIPPKEKTEGFYKYLAFKISPLTKGERNAIHPNRVSFCGQIPGASPPSCDGIIEFDDNTEQKIEVTWANRNEAYGEQKRDLRKGDVYLGSVISSNDIVEWCLNAINKKCNHKYKDCWLLVVVENWGIESFDSGLGECFLSGILSGLDKLNWDNIFTSVVVCFRKN